jgi:hypothetical protein
MIKKMEGKKCKIRINVPKKKSSKRDYFGKLI